MKNVQHVVECLKDFVARRKEDDRPPDYDSFEGVTFNIFKDNEGRRKQHSRSFMARREPRVLTLGQL
ncbi:hypothetical protein TNCV_3759121 [Trichonephila clavipes]|nr:hypothetical protein TNCV_3759121 [Trichonephila clavipes]